MTEREHKRETEDQKTVTLRRPIPRNQLRGSPLLKGADGKLKALGVKLEGSSKQLQRP